MHSPTNADGKSLGRDSSSPAKRKLSPKTSLHLDLSNLSHPAVEPPTQATNTVLIAHFQNLSLFEEEHQSKIRAMIETTAPVTSWVPLKSFRRILASFATVDRATAVRAAWDSSNMQGDRVRVFYGPLIPESQFKGPQYLALPDAGRLYLTSPPSSPPCDWKGRVEDAPNKMVHAKDLAAALYKVHLTNPQSSPVDDHEPAAQGAVPLPLNPNRTRPGTLIYHPEDHGNYPNLPTIAVVNPSDEPEKDPETLRFEKGIRTIMTRRISKAMMVQTSRPPVKRPFQS